MFDQNSFTKTLRDLAELIRQKNDIPLYEKILDLQGQLVQFANERDELVSENRDLRRQLQIKAKIHFENPYFWQEEDEVPLCPNCYSGSGETMRIHLTHPSQDYGGGHGRLCSRCGHFYREGPRKVPLPESEPMPYWE